MAGEGKGPPPDELRFAWRVKQWGDPFGGGWMDWEAGLIDKVSTLSNIYDAFQRYHNSNKSAEWTRRNKSVWQTVGKIKKMRAVYWLAEDIAEKQGGSVDLWSKAIEAAENGRDELIRLLGYDGKGSSLLGIATFFGCQVRLV